MLGWHICIYKQTDEGASPATAKSPEGSRLAVWQTGLGRLDWIDDLVKEGKAFDFGGSGNPCRYTATAAYLTPRIVDQPPGALNTWIAGASDVFTEKWEGRTVGPLGFGRGDEEPSVSRVELVWPHMERSTSEDVPLPVPPVAVPRVTKFV